MYKRSKAPIAGVVLLLLMYLSYSGSNMSALYKVNYSGNVWGTASLYALLNVAVNTLCIGFLPFILKLVNIDFYNRYRKPIFIFNGILWIIFSIPLFNLIYGANDSAGIGLLGSLIFSFAVYFLINNKVYVDSLDNDADNNVEVSTFKCSDCGAIVSENASECPNCGASFKEEDNFQETFKCDNCGAIVPKNATECPNCGELFYDEESSDNLNNLYETAEKNKRTNKSKAKDMYLEYISKTEKIMKSNEEKCYTFGNCVEFSIAAKNGELEDDKCIDINFKTSDAYLNLAIISFDEKDYDNAIKLLNKSLKLNPCNISSLFEMAENYKAKGELLKYFNWTKKCYEKIYYVNHLAHYYRNLGFYYIEKKEWDLAKTLYLYSLKYDANPVVTTELQYIIKVTNDKSLPSKENLTSILRKNEIPTFIKKENLNLIKDLYNSFEKDGQLDSEAGKFLSNLMKENSNTK